MQHICDKIIMRMVREGAEQLLFTVMGSMRIGVAGPEQLCVESIDISNAVALSSKAFRRSPHFLEICQKLVTVM